MVRLDGSVFRPKFRKHSHPCSRHPTAVATQEQAWFMLKKVFAPASHRTNWPMNIYLLDLWPSLPAGDLDKAQLYVDTGPGAADEFCQVSTGVAVLAVGAFGHLPKKIILPSSEGRLTEF